MKQTLTLENLPIDFGDTAFLSIVTQVPDFMLADDLNHLYDLRLHRIDDLPNFNYPSYLSDDICHSPLVYRLLHMVGSDLSGFLLIVTGSWRAKSVVKQIGDEFNAPNGSPSPYDLPEQDRQSILHRYRSSFSMVSEVTFTEDELQQASFPGRRTLKGRAALADQYARILDAIDLSSM